MCESDATFGHIFPSTYRFIAIVPGRRSRRCTLMGFWGISGWKVDSAEQCSFTSWNILMFFSEFNLKKHYSVPNLHKSLSDFDIFKPRWTKHLKCCILRKKTLCSVSSCFLLLLYSTNSSHTWLSGLLSPAGFIPAAQITDLGWQVNAIN